MKKLLSLIITLCILFGATYLLSNLMNSKMIDWAFGIGLFFTLVLLFLSGKGNFSVNIDNQAQAASGIKQHYEETNYPGKYPFALYVSITYTIVSFIGMIGYYWKEI
ncbi:hypothetical protein J5Y03_13970 [Bacillus sp. RG28]|uniref:Uncharacterized protein n=1 Tax=Gottfriedia endophytica TaxID=2820819 RepID=A0A940NRK9_9BACI|nr:hypothetical protein [Gottfriedia endophytica]MBP0726263.1 hypothetical protein [Gottfriedia endophytica]